MRRKAKVAIGVSIALLAGTLALPSASTAGTAQVLNGALSFEASSGETNRLTITYEDLGSFESRYTFEDLGAAVTPGFGCTAISANKVSCEGDFENIAIDVGDLADSVTMPRLYRPSGSTVPCFACPAKRFEASVAGGDGDDVLNGGHATGGSSRDSPLESLRGGRGRDRITSGPYAGEGGPGPYTKLFGGQDDDELRCADNHGGFCLIDAGEGADDLRGGSSRDGFIAGPGDDSVRSADDSAEDVDCGEGSDRFESDPMDRVTNCETLLSASARLSPPSARGRRRGGFITSVIAGRLTGTGRTPCAGQLRIRIRAGRKLVASRHATLRANCRYRRRLVVPVRRLPRRQRRRLSRGKPIVLAATVRYLGHGGLPPDRSPTRRFRVYA